MKLRNAALAAAAFGLATAPVLAQASFDRSVAPTEGEDLEGTTGILVTVLGVAAVVAAVIIIADDDDDDDAVSP